MKRFGIAAILLCAACDRTTPKADGAQPLGIPDPGPSSTFEFSHDGRLAYAMYVKGKNAVYVGNSDGSNAKRVSFGIWDFGPLWSPDGKWIAFGRDMGGHSDVSIVPADSGAERVVASTATDEVPSGWRGDGSAFLYVKRTSGGYEMWQYRMADGANERVFEADGSVGGYPARKANLVAYVLTKGGKTTLWLWDGDKKTHRQLTTDGFEALSDHAFSPDDASLLYSSRRSGTSDIWRVDLASGTRTQITQDVADDYAPEWSPDGRRIAFVSNRGGQPDIWVTSGGEADVQRVTNDATSESKPRWTADGRSILSVVSPGHQHLYSMPVDSTPAHALTSGDWDVLGAARSDDRTMVAYVGNKNGDQDIWVIPATGGESRLVAGGPGNDYGPSWSHDGKQLAFVSVRSGNADIWIVSVEGGAPRRLLDWPTDERNPRWSPDGKSITFVSGRESSGSDLWMVPVGGGPAKRLTTLGTVGAHVWSHDGKWLTFGAQSKTSGGFAGFVVGPAGGEPMQLAPATVLDLSWSSSDKYLTVGQCLANGSCRIELRSPDGKFLRTLNDTPEIIYEFSPSWSTDESEVAITCLDLAGNGDGYIEIRSAPAGALVRRLPNPPGLMTQTVGFAAGDKSLLALAVPRSSRLMRIPVPPAQPQR